MPRRPRLGALGVLHCVMVRGVERHALFRNDIDRADFVARLVALVSATGLTVYAWRSSQTMLIWGTRPSQTRFAIAYFT